MNKLAVVRVRGSVNVREEVKDTLRMLNLSRPNYCTVVENSSSFRGMLEKVKEMVTWGPIEPEVLEKLLLKKGEFKGGEKVTEDKIKELTSYNSLEGLANAVVEGDFALNQIEDLKKVFRLHPPKKGYNSTHRSVKHGGALGNRGEEINSLILRML
ncbi:hypothetical protein AKJ62_01735 [candidate division MSBL1 archaeon SCGC-AAA259D14]|uniref:Large ribosomal subunit protein uL30 n=1 Tax=candidate division MSBL1 archaeon SCGC-AAA259D14 TaxID=1698261 RepID=A0A133U7E5_9EURY|nr:hypothetical protein AKJ62_01735 [candidate division MSBL1 archaeon SCGC-AAA259D14]